MIIYPKADFEKVNEITYEFLKDNKLNALVLDMDNTLIDFYRNLPEDNIKWAKELKQKGIKLYILTNTNKKDKVEEVSKKLEIPYIYLAHKPLKKGFLMVQKELGEKPENVGVVGDQLFTDILGANRCKMFPILVEPMDKKDIWITILKRPIENFLKNQYKKKQTKEKN